MSLRTRVIDAVLCAKVQPVLGTYSAPDDSADQIEHGGGLLAPENPQVITPNTNSDTIIDRPDEVGRVGLGLPLNIPVKGTSLTSSLVDPPEYEPTMRAGGFEPVGSAATSAVKSGGNTGNGTLTGLAITSAILGVWQVRITIAAANGGTFSVTDPNGRVVGVGSVGTLFTGGGFSFTVNDGSTDFIVGDGFDLTVTLDAAIGTAAVTAAALVSGNRTITIDISVDTDLPAGDGALVGRVINVKPTGSGADEPMPCIGYDVTGTDAVITFPGDHFSATLTTSTTITVPASRRSIVHDSPVVNSIKMYREGRLLKGKDCSFALTIRTEGSERYILEGRYVGRYEGDRVNAAVPDDATDQTHVKPRSKNGFAILGDRLIAHRATRFDMGATLYNADNYNEIDGQEATCIPRMRPRFTIDPAVDSLEERDELKNYLDNAWTTCVIGSDVAQAAGSRVLLTLPRIKLTTYTEGDRDGMLIDQIEYQIDPGQRPVWTEY